jgi:hypothetical protein
LAESRRLLALGIATGAALVATLCTAAPLAAQQNGGPTAPPPVSVAPAPVVAPLAPFKVVFGVTWRGMNAGTASLELERLNGSRWRYTSRNNARGLFRIAFPDEITQTSEFALNGTVRPLRFRGDDGSDGTSRDVRLDFDWNAQRVTGVAEDRKVDLELRPDLQDPMSVQIALMVELAAGRSPADYWILDKDRIKDYEYRAEGRAVLRTAAGEFDTVIWSSRRPGSDRVTRVWYAPARGYAPVRAERLRGGSVEFAMTLRSLAT